VSENEKLAFALVDGLGGVAESVGAGGGVRSIDQVYEAAVLWFTAASTAVTENVCCPSVRPV
jgi:hypothetical protein